jgi:hypothetical protein
MTNAPDIASHDGPRSPLAGRQALLCLDDVVGWAVTVEGRVATADEAATSPRRRVRRLGNQAARRNARHGDLAARWPSVGPSASPTLGPARPPTKVA